jgi:hypothetical protein
MKALPTQSPSNWRHDLRPALVLGLAGALATAALFPYLLELTPQLRQKIHIALPLMVFLQSLQAALLLGLMAFIGLRMSHRSNLQAPWLRAWLARGPLPEFPWATAVLAGLATGALLLGLIQFIDPHLPPPLHPAVTGAVGSPWLGFLASFYGGIGEEIQLRLFLMTLLVWLLARITGKAPTPVMYWTAIALAALAFGAGHLPAAAQIWPLDAVVVGRTILVNAAAGLVFGWLYWRRGLEVAMLAHFSADLVLHVAAPLLSRVAS